MTLPHAPPPDDPRGWFDRLQPWLAGAVLLAGVAWLVSEWTDFADAWGRIGAGAFATGTGLLILMLLAEAWGWRTMAASVGAGLPAGQALRVWSHSQLGQYLPGTLWFAAGRVMLAVGYGAPAAAVAGAVVIDAIGWVTVGLVLAAVSAPLCGGHAVAAWVWWLVVAVAAVPAGTFVFSPALRRGPWGAWLPAAPPVKAAAAMAGLQAVAWLLDCACFVVLAAAVIPLEGWDLVRAGAIFQSAGLAGTLTVVMPHGLGTQEVLIRTGLRALAGEAAVPGAGAAVAVAMRVATLAAEFALAGVLWMLVPGPASPTTIRPA